MDGDAECFKLLLELGCRVDDTGFICLSPKEKNEVYSNVIGAAAYRGNLEVLKLVRSSLPQLLTRSATNFKASEKMGDRQGADRRPLQAELARHTPLMLA